MINISNSYQNQLRIIAVIISRPPAAARPAGPRFALLCLRPGRVGGGGGGRRRRRGDFFLFFS